MALNQTVKLGIFCAMSIVLTSCATSSRQQVDLKTIYDKSAQYHKPDRNPIIVIPGILGSRLVDDNTGQTIWGAFSAEYADPKTSEGVHLISLPIETDIETQHEYEDRDEHIRPDGVLENLELSLAGFPISIQAYAGILTTLGAGGYRDQSLGLNSIDYGTDHFTCFQFDYDWRQDITYNARALKEFMDERRVEIQAQYKKRYGLENAEVKFDIVAHSMGSLLTRYFLRYGATRLPPDGSQPTLTWAGANDVERTILVAPPNAGSLDAFDQLINGFNEGRPLLPHYPPAILGTFPSVYQLLPRTRHNAIVWDEDTTKPVTDLYSPEVWQKYGWGLSSKDEGTTEILESILPHINDAEERSRIAERFQAQALERAQQFQLALDKPATPPDGLELFLVVGDATDTPEVISVDSQTGRSKVFKTGIGDKTVLRTSAIMDERIGGEWKPAVQSPIEWTSVLFVPSEQRKITSDPVFEDNVLYWLLEDPR